MKQSYYHGNACLYVKWKSSPRYTIPVRYIGAVTSAQSVFAALQGPMKMIIKGDNIWSRQDDGKPHEKFIQIVQLIDLSIW